MNDPKTSFGKILDIIGYSGSKEDLYINLLGLCYSNALLDLIETLPEDKRQEAAKAIFGTKDAEHAENVKRYFNSDQITAALKKTSEKIFSEYYDSIMPSLSDAKVTQLNDYLSSIVP